MAKYITPNIGLSGLYQLAPELSNYYNPKVPYTCKSIRTLEDITRNGESLLEDYYIPLGLNQDSVTKDIQRKATIVGLVTDDNKWIYIPNTYIISMPSQSGIKYTPVSFGATIGPVHDNFDYTGFKSAVNDLVLKYFGVTSEVYIMTTGQTTYLSSSEHANIVRARADKFNQSDYGPSKLQKLTSQVQSFKKTIGILENYIISQNSKLNQDKDLLESNKQEINTLKLELTGKEQQVAILQTENLTAQNTIATLTAKIAELQATIAEKDNIINQLQNNTGP